MVGRVCSMETTSAIIGVLRGCRFGLREFENSFGIPTKNGGLESYGLGRRILRVERRQEGQP